MVSIISYCKLPFIHRFTKNIGGHNYYYFRAFTYGYGYRVGTHAWNIIQLSRIVYAIAYVFILLALIQGLERIRYNALALASPIIVGDIISIILLLVIILVPEDVLEAR